MKLLGIEKESYADKYNADFRIVPRWSNEFVHYVTNLAASIKFLF